jgi:hypothetical protein
MGGIIIPKEVSGNVMWQYCRNKIKDTVDLKGWDYFDPATLTLK